MGFLFRKTANISMTDNKLSGINIQNSSQGLAIPMVYGMTRTPGNIIWYGDFTAIPHTETQSSGGGKGGGGGGSQSQTSYTYTTGVAIAVSEGPVTGFGRAWEGKNITTPAALGLTTFAGSYTQLPWTYLDTYHPTEAFGYRGQSYAASGAYNLGGGASLPNISFEVQGLLYDSGIYDTTTAQVMYDVLTSGYYGAGFPVAQIGVWSGWYNYCRAAGLVVSPAYTTQRPAADIVTELALISNTAPVWSEGTLKMIPYADEAITGAWYGTITNLPTPVFDPTTVEWTIQVSAANYNWVDITHAASLFVAVAAHGSVGLGAHAMTSPDGITWTIRTTPTGTTSDYWYGVTYGASVFVAVSGGNDGLNGVMTSPDGITWTGRTAVGANLYRAVAFGNSVFVAVASGAAAGESVMTSATGTSGWTLRSTPTTGGDWADVVYGAGLFVAVAGSGGSGTANYEVMTSPDGITWTLRATPAGKYWQSVTFGNSKFVAVEAYPGSASAVMTSLDGITWTLQDTPAGHYWLSVTYGAGFFVAVTDDGAGSMVSADAETWELAPGANSNWWQAVAVSSDTFAAVATSGTGDRVMTGLPGLGVSPVTYTPDTAICYVLTDDDFLAQPGDAPIKVIRKRQADAYNSVTVECLDRDNDYNVYVAEAKDQWNIDLYGLRPMPVVSAHMICLIDVGRQVAQTILQRVLYIRNNYEFTLGIRFARLEPMDLVSLTDTGLGLNAKTVRVISVEEDEEFNLHVIAEDYLGGGLAPGVYSTQGSSGYIVNQAVDPGDSVAPIIIQPPIELTSTPQVWVASAGGANWGGAEVWVSSDAATYTKLGTLTAPGRFGVLTANLPAVADPDLISTLSANLSVSSGTLESVPQDQANALATLSYVGNGTGEGELLAYADANLTSSFNYDMSYLRRGRSGTASQVHLTGETFLRLDDAVEKFMLDTSWIGVTLYLKLLSFNKTGGGLQSLADVTATPYAVQPVGMSLQNGAVPTIIPLDQYYYVAPSTQVAVPNRLTIYGRLLSYGRTVITP